MVDGTDLDESENWTGISDDQAKKIIALLDEWIEDCERTSESYRDIPDIKLRQLAADLADAISSTKEYRNSIQSNNQSWWALAMLQASKVASVRAQLSKELHQTVPRMEANLKRLEKSISRQRLLKEQIEANGYSMEDLSSNRGDRNEIREWYKKEFELGDRTFRDDFKSLGGKPK